MNTDIKDPETGILKTYDSDFCHWGKRDYVHGSHMIYGVMSAVEAWKLGNLIRFSASFRYNLRKQGKYLLFQDRNSIFRNKKKLYTTFELFTDKGVHLVGLSCNGRLITKKSDDDEEALIKDCKIDSKSMSAMIRGPGEGGIINVIIALNKCIHKKVIHSKNHKLWFLARLDLYWRNIMLKTPDTIKVRIVRIIGDKMTKSIIEVDGNNVGEIFFNRELSHARY